MDISFLDPLILSRVQFAFTIAFHIIFPSFTIGLASWLLVLEIFYLKTNHPIYQEIYKFWVKIFAVTFGMGVVLGLVLSYELGTNWSVFTDKVGSVIGPLMGFEVLTAFFLESSFLGIMLFGWDRVSPKMHCISTACVAVGTLLSAFWILSAVSWMHTPQGYEVADNGILKPTNWLEVIFNPSFPYRLVHMITAAYLTTAFTVGGIAAWYLWKKQFIKHAKIMFAMAMFMAIFAAPMQLLFGDMHGLNTLKHQPVKVSAMEGIWETEKGAALKIFGIPDAQHEITRYNVEIPKLSRLILTHDFDGEVKGLKAWPKQERPNVMLVFFSFRVMVGVGFLMILTGVIAIILILKQKLFTARWFHLLCKALTPSGFIAIIAGWFVTECGRQPYVVYKVLRTSDALSNVAGSSVAVSLAMFIIVYILVFGAGTYYILKLIAKGPKVGNWIEMYGTHGLHHGISWADVFLKDYKGSKNV